MADQEEAKHAEIKLEFTEEVTHKLKAAVDQAVAAGKPATVSLQLSQDAHAAFVSQLTKGPATATALIHNVPEKEDEEPEPLPEEETEETEEEETA